MKNTTTKTTANRAEKLRSIMKRAWQIKKQDSQNIFSLCLAMAWDEATTPTATDIINEWHNLATTAQLNFVTAELKYTCKIEIGKSTESNYAQINDKWLWETYGLSMQELQNTCFVEVLARLNPEYINRQINLRIAHNQAITSGEKEGHLYSTYRLKTLVFASCKNGLQKLYRNEIKHVKAKATYDTMTDKDGNQTAIIDTLSDKTALQLLENAETKALTAGYYDTISDTINKQIFIALIKGKTEREIVDIVNMSKTGIHKRIEKIRIDFRQYLNA